MTFRRCFQQLPCPGTVGDEEMKLYGAPDARYRKNYTNSSQSQSCSKGFASVLAISRGKMSKLYLQDFCRSMTADASCTKPMKLEAETSNDRRGRLGGCAVPCLYTTAYPDNAPFGRRGRPAAACGADVYRRWHGFECSVRRSWLLTWTALVDVPFRKVHADWIPLFGDQAKYFAYYAAE